jgi:hypothetical protein
MTRQTAGKAPKWTDRLADFCSLSGTCDQQGAMPDYRAYIVGIEGRFVRAIELLCPDDDTAKEYARKLVDGHDVELWQGKRQIAKFQRKAE